MTDLAAGDLTYSFNIKDKVFMGRKGYQVRGTITFGNGSLTVPAAGIPITKGKLGLPRFVRSLQVLESNISGYTFEYDVSAEKLLVASIPATTGNIAAVTGNVSAPKISLGLGTGANVNADLVIGVNSVVNGAFLVGSSNSIVNITGVQAPTFTGDAPVFTGDALTLDNFAGAPASMVLEILAQGY